VEKDNNSTSFLEDQFKRDRERQSQHGHHWHDSPE
jgi:hypothetical protein